MFNRLFVHAEFVLSTMSIEWCIGLNIGVNFIVSCYLIIDKNATKDYK